MALTTQAYATTGRQRRPPYLDIINAQAPYLPYYREAEEEQERFEKGHQLDKRRLALERRRLAEETELANRDLAMRGEYYRDLEKQGTKARRMGWANIGLQTGLGLADALNIFDTPTNTLSDRVGTEIMSHVADEIYDPGGLTPLEGLPTTGGTDFDIPFVPEVIEKPLEWMWDLGGNIYDTAIDFIGDIFS